MSYRKKTDESKACQLYPVIVETLKPAQDRADPYQNSHPTIPDSAGMQQNFNEHLMRLQAVKNIALRAAVDTLRYDRNDTVTRNLQYKTAIVKIKKHADKLFLAEH